MDQGVQARWKCGMKLEEMIIETMFPKRGDIHFAGLLGLHVSHPGPQRSCSTVNGTLFKGLLYFFLYPISTKDF